MVEKIANQLNLANKLGLIKLHADAKEYAQFIFNSWEGALLRAKNMKNREPLDLFMKIIFESN